MTESAQTVETEPKASSPLLTTIPLGLLPMAPQGEVCGPDGCC